MSKVENNANPVSTEPSYLVGFTNQSRDDEIDLVDLWIVMWSYRKLFLSSLILVAVIGIVCFELLYNPKPASKVTVRSVIEIESIISDGRHISVVDAGVLIKRIELVMLPRISSLSQFEQIKHLIMATKVSRVGTSEVRSKREDSNIVEIVNKLPTGEIDDLSRFHDLLVDEVMQELKKSAELLKADVHDTLILVKSRIVNLEGLIIALEQDLLDGGNSQVASDQSLQNEIALKKANIQSEINLLTERIKYLELSLSNGGSHVLLKAGVSSNTSRSNKPVAYVVIFMLSVFLALFLTMGVIFARKVKARMATGD